MILMWRMVGKRGGGPDIKRIAAEPSNFPQIFIENFCKIKTA